MYRILSMFQQTLLVMYWYEGSSKKLIEYALKVSDKAIIENLLELSDKNGLIATCLFEAFNSACMNGQHLQIDMFFSCQNQNPLHAIISKDYNKGFRYACKNGHRGVILIHIHNLPKAILQQYIMGHECSAFRKAIRNESYDISELLLQQCTDGMQLELLHSRHFVIYKLIINCHPLDVSFRKLIAAFDGNIVMDVLSKHYSIEASYIKLLDFELLHKLRLTP